MSENNNVVATSRFQITSLEDFKEFIHMYGIDMPYEKTKRWGPYILKENGDIIYDYKVADHLGYVNGNGTY